MSGAAGSHGSGRTPWAATLTTVLLLGGTFLLATGCGQHTTRETTTGATTTVPSARPSPSPTDDDDELTDDELSDDESDDSTYDDNEDDGTYDDSDNSDDSDDVGDDSEDVGPTPTTPSGDGSDPSWMLGRGEYDTDVDRALRQTYGCRPKQGAVGTLLCMSSGMIVETGLSVESHVLSISMLYSGTADSGLGSFDTYTGTLPLGLRWGMTRNDVEPFLQNHFGQAVNHWDGGQGSYVSDDYAVTGQPFRGLTVQYDNADGRLFRVEISVDTPMHW